MADIPAAGAGRHDCTLHTDPAACGLHSRECAWYTDSCARRCNRLSRKDCAVRPTDCSWNGKNCVNSVAAKAAAKAAKAPAKRAPRKAAAKAAGAPAAAAAAAALAPAAAIPQALDEEDELLADLQAVLDAPLPPPPPAPPAVAAAKTAAAVEAGGVHVAFLLAEVDDRVRRRLAEAEETTAHLRRFRDADEASAARKEAAARWQGELDAARLEFNREREVAGKKAEGHGFFSYALGAHGGEGAGLAPTRAQADEIIQNMALGARRRRQEAEAAPIMARAYQLAQRRIEDDRTKKTEALRAKLIETGDLDSRGNRPMRESLLEAPLASPEGVATVLARLDLDDVPPIEKKRGAEGLSGALFVPTRSFGEHHQEGWKGLGLKVTKDKFRSEESKDAFRNLATLATSLGEELIGPRVFGHGIFGPGAREELRHRGWTLEALYATDLHGLLTARASDTGYLYVSRPGHVLPFVASGVVQRALDLARLGFLPGDVKPANILVRLLPDGVFDVRFTDFDPYMFVKWPEEAYAVAQTVCRDPFRATQALSTAAAFVTLALLQWQLDHYATRRNLDAEMSAAIQKELGHPVLVPEIVRAFIGSEAVQKHLLSYGRRVHATAHKEIDRLLAYTAARDCASVELGQRQLSEPVDLPVFSPAKTAAVQKLLQEAWQAAKRTAVQARGGKRPGGDEAMRVKKAVSKAVRLGQEERLAELERQRAIDRAMAHPLRQHPEHDLAVRKGWREL